MAIGGATGLGTILGIGAGVAAVGIAAVGYVVLTGGPEVDPGDPSVEEPAGIVEAAAEDSAATQPPAAEASAPVAPSFDLVRIEPSGAALIAGRAAEGATVTIVLDGVELQQVQADASGAFTILTDIEPADTPRILSLDETQPDGSQLASDQTVIVAPAPDGVGDVAELAALEPDAEPLAEGASMAVDPVNPVDPVVQAGADTIRPEPVVEESASLVEPDEAGADAGAVEPAETIAAEPLQVADAATAEPDPAQGDIPRPVETATALPEEVDATDIQIAAVTPDAQPPSRSMGGGQGVGEQAAASDQAADIAADVDTAVTDPVPSTGDQAAENRVTPLEAEVDAAQPVETVVGQSPVPPIAVPPTGLIMPGAEVALGVTPGPDAPPSPPATAAPLVLLSEPAGIRVLQSGGGAVPQIATDQIVLETISYDENGDVVLAGRGRVEGGLRVYLDNQPVPLSSQATQVDWQAQLPVVNPGTYTLRIDALASDGTVTSRVETPFLREDPADLPDPGDGAVVTVQPGNTLWGISRERFGEGVLYVHVYEANRGQIRDPDLIYPGQIFEIPDLSEVAQP